MVLTLVPRRPRLTSCLPVSSSGPTLRPRTPPMIRFHCPFCNCLLSAPEECVRRVSRCNCGNSSTVPQALGNPPGPPGGGPQTAAGPAGSYPPPRPGPTPATHPRRGTAPRQPRPDPAVTSAVRGPLPDDPHNDK